MTAEAERSRRRAVDQPWRAWYRTKRWYRIRWATLVRDHFTCRMCRRMEPDTSQLICDHIERHGGDAGKFWVGPFQTLCKPCHDGAKQAQEKGGSLPGSQADGVPVDPGHHWNR